MTETLYSLVLDYGAALIFGATFLSCLLVPIPSSVLMLVGGAFAAAGDLSLPLVAGAAYGGAVLGDQAGYRIGRAGGAAVVARLAQRPARARLLARAQAALDRYGGVAVFFSTWAVAQIGPWVNFLAGAGGMGPWRFTLWDAAGEAIWVALYVGLGYVFAGQIEALLDIVPNIAGFLAAGTVTVLLGALLLARAGGVRRRLKQGLPPKG